MVSPVNFEVVSSHCNKLRYLQRLDHGSADDFHWQHKVTGAVSATMVYCLQYCLQTEGNAKF